MLQRSVGPEGIGSGARCNAMCFRLGPSCAVAGDTAGERICDSPTSPLAGATPRSVDSQPEAAHEPDRECGAGGPIDPSADSGDTTKSVRTGRVDRPAHHSPEASRETTGRVPGDGGFADAELSAEVADGDPDLGLPDGIDDLLFGEL